MTGPLRDVRYVADYLGMSESKVRQHAHSGDWPAVRFGGMWRWTDDMLADIVARHTQPARTPPAAAAQVTPLRTRQARGPQRRTA